MIKPPFMEELEKFLRPEERIFKFRNAELSGNFFKLELLADRDAYDRLLDDALQSKVKESAEKIIPRSFRLSVKFIKACNEESTVIKHLLEYVYREKPTVYNGFQSAPIETEVGAGVIYVRVTLEKYLHEYAVNSGLKEELDDYLSRCVMEDVEVDFLEIPNADGEIKLNSRPGERVNALRTVNVDITEYYSGSIAQNPRYIADVKDKEAAQVCLCGVISDVKPRYIEKIDKTLYTFFLGDTTSAIKVKYFARKLKKVDWEKVFTDGASLVMEGQIKYDNFDASYAFFPRNIAKCTVDYSSVNVKSDFLPEPAEYVRVFPKKIEAGFQDSLLAAEPNPEFAKNVFVVFDVETTGLEPTRDEIIELAAVKIVNGEICESFDTLIDPGFELPRKIVEITNITDEMLKGQYAIGEIIGDFYKFTRGAVLVAHNASFDMGFLSIAGKKHKYDFDNSYLDTLAMARQKLRLRHNDLSSVCAYFKIPLVNAHRAINDTLATAKMFIELMNM